MTTVPDKFPEGVSRVPVGLVFTKDIDYDTWASIAPMFRKRFDKLALKVSELQWGIGDWLLYGEARYGEKYSQAMNDTGFTYGYLANMASLAKKYPIDERVVELSWSHHNTVKSHVDKYLLLEKAKTQDLTVSQLEELKKEYDGARNQTSQQNENIRLPVPPVKDGVDLLIEKGEALLAALPEEERVVAIEAYLESKYEPLVSSLPEPALTEGGDANESDSSAHGELSSLRDTQGAVEETAQAGAGGVEVEGGISEDLQPEKFTDTNAYIQALEAERDHWKAWGKAVEAKLNDEVQEVASLRERVGIQVSRLNGPILPIPYDLEEMVKLELEYKQKAAKGMDATLDFESVGLLALRRGLKVLAADHGRKR